MKIHIEEAFRHMPEIGPHVMEGHYSLENSQNGEHILPGLWGNTIKPGASIKMTMWPDLNLHPLLHFYRSPPFCPSPREAAEAAAKRQRFSRMQNVTPLPTASRASPFRFGLPRPPMPFGYPGGPPPPPPPPPPMLASRGPMGPNNRTSHRRAWSISTIDEDEMTVAEEKELTFVNFVEEMERTKSLTTTDILAKYTQLQDILGQECLDEWGVEETLSSSDSDDSGSSISGSVSVVD